MSGMAPTMSGMSYGDHDLSMHLVEPPSDFARGRLVPESPELYLSARDFRHEGARGRRIEIQARLSAPSDRRRLSPEAEKYMATPGLPLWRRPSGL
jgi:hypothetical protein